MIQLQRFPGNNDIHRTFECNVLELKNLKIKAEDRNSTGHKEMMLYNCKSGSFTKNLLLMVEHRGRQRLIGNVADGTGEKGNVCYLVHVIYLQMTSMDCPFFKTPRKGFQCFPIKKYNLRRVIYLNCIKLHSVCTCVNVTQHCIKMDKFPPLRHQLK